jgi:hypothetical protein
MSTILRPSIADARSHGLQLLADNGITLDPTYRGRRGAVVLPRARIIRMASDAIGTFGSYASLLHEAGHILGPGQSGSRIEQEVGAWLWAHIVAMPGAVKAETFRVQVARSMLSYRHLTCHRPEVAAARKALVVGMTPETAMITARKLWSRWTGTSHTEKD